MSQTGPTDEVPLAGGRITKGVVRIGDSVRRPAKPVSGAIGCLLRHLENQGFGGAPRYLGADANGRDVLSYVSGDVLMKWQLFPDETIIEAAKLLRAFHDATLGCELLQGRPVICHNDPGPNNVVFQNGLGRNMLTPLPIGLRSSALLADRQAAFIERLVQWPVSFLAAEYSSCLQLKRVRQGNRNAADFGSFLFD